MVEELCRDRSTCLEAIPQDGNWDQYRTPYVSYLWVTVPLLGRLFGADVPSWIVLNDDDRALNRDWT
jgi:hypothetical protein